MFQAVRLTWWNLLGAMGLALFHAALGRGAMWTFPPDDSKAVREYLDHLRILYDPRLETGMTEAEAMPIVRRIVAE